MYRGMHAAQREVAVPSGLFTQTQSCIQLRLTGGCNTCGKLWWALTRPPPLLFLKKTDTHHTLTPVQAMSDFMWSTWIHPIHYALLTAAPDQLIGSRNKKEGRGSHTSSYDPVTWPRSGYVSVPFYPINIFLSCWSHPCALSCFW